MLGIFLGLSTMTITNLKWVILRGMWCPPSTGQADRTKPNIPASPPDLRQQLLGSTCQMRQRRKGKGWATCCWVLCCVNKALEIQTGCLKKKKKRTFKTFNAAHHVHTNRTGLHIQNTHSWSDTQLIVQRHFPQNAVHSDLLGSFMDWYFLTFY